MLTETAIYLFTLQRDISPFINQYAVIHLYVFNRLFFHIFKGVIGHGD